MKCVHSRRSAFRVLRIPNPDSFPPPPAILFCLHYARDFSFFSMNKLLYEKNNQGRERISFQQEKRKIPFLISKEKDSGIMLKKSAAGR